MAKSKAKTSAKADKKAASTGSNTDKIAALRAEIEKLEAEELALQNPHQEYPKFIADPSQPGKGRIVNTAEEESAAKGGEGDLVPMSDEFTVVETLEEDVDAQAGGAHGNRKKVTTNTKTFKNPAQAKSAKSGGDAKKAEAKKASAKKPGLASKLASKLRGKK